MERLRRLKGKAHLVRHLVILMDGFFDQHTLPYHYRPVDIVRHFPNLETLHVSVHIPDTNYGPESYRITAVQHPQGEESGIPMSLRNFTLLVLYSDGYAYHGNQPLRSILQQLQRSRLESFSLRIGVNRYSERFDRESCLSDIIEAYRECEFSNLNTVRLHIALPTSSQDPEIDTCVSHTSVWTTHRLLY